MSGTMAGGGLHGADQLMRTFQSMLFVPGNRPDRIDKALASDSGLICIDLEDAVAPQAKDEARSATLEALARVPCDRMVVRINGIETLAGLADIGSFAVIARLPCAIMLPKVEHARDLEITASLLGERAPPLIALIETTRAVMEAGAIARSPHCGALMLGGADLAAQLGVTMAWEPLLAARSAIVIAAASAGIAAIDVPYVAIDDDEGLAQEAVRARALGFTAKAAIHPRQLDGIHAAFRPSEAAIVQARNAIAAFEAGGSGAIQFEGRLLEAPIIARFRRMLAAVGE